MPTFTQKHYKKVASFLREEVPQDEAIEIALTLTRLFKRDNPKFSRDRFLRASGALKDEKQEE